MYKQKILEETADFTAEMPAPQPDLKLPDTPASLPLLNAPKTNRAIRYVQNITGTNGGIIEFGSHFVTTYTVVAPISFGAKTVNGWLNSTPVYLGEFTVSEDGTIPVEFDLPAGVEPGFHTLHLYGTNTSNEAVDLYTTVYVKDPANTQQCVVVTDSGVDADQDGVDDACDGYVEPDVLAPVVVAPDRDANDQGWYNGDVSISWSSTDPSPSSGTPTQPPNTLASTEGEHTYTSEPSCDPAGHCATGSLTLFIDKSPPLINYSLGSQPNANGWHDSDVTVSFECSDSISGVQSCPSPVTVGEGTNQTVMGTAIDKAGNSSVLEVTLNIDKSIPTINHSLTPAANANGWNNSDVTVSFGCSDAASGIFSCSDSVIVSSEGANQTVVGTAVDKADNSDTKTAIINLDKTLPVLGTPAVSQPVLLLPGSVMVTAAVSDSLSGVELAEVFVNVDPGLGNGTPMIIQDGVARASVPIKGGLLTTHTVSVRTKDKAGNWSPVKSVKVFSVL